MPSYSYGLSLRPKSHQAPPKEQPPAAYSAYNTAANLRATTSSAGSASFSDALAADDALLLSNEPYFLLSSEQQDALLEDARAAATALIVDTLSGFDKWRFLAVTGGVQLFELKPDAADRVSAMCSDDGHHAAPPPGDAPQSHTLLAITRVRAKLDDFMRIAATDKRDKFQNLLAHLHEDDVQHADVFTSFGGLGGGGVSSHNSSSADLLSSSFTSNSSFGSSRAAASGACGVNTEQYAIKYLSLKEPKPSSKGAASRANKLLLKSKSARHGAARGGSGSDGLTLCVGEYATIRQGKVRANSAQRAMSVDDHRIGIVACHSLEDPQITRYCKPIASTTGSGFAVTTRSFAQFSGLVVYPVESPVPGESVLEVVAKMSCFDAKGISGLKKQAMLQYLVAYRRLENALLVLRLHDSPFLSSSSWAKSEQRRACNVCQQSFPSFRRKHHCRLCGEVVCSKCSSMHTIKLAKSGANAFRICTACLNGSAGDGAQQPQQIKFDHSDPEDGDEEVVEVDSQLQPIVRHEAQQFEFHQQQQQQPEQQQRRWQQNDLPQQQQKPLQVPQKQTEREEPQHEPLLHKQQLEQHDSRLQRHDRESRRSKRAEDKQRTESTTSSAESEYNDARGFLASNVTATTAASTPPSTSGSPLSSSPVSPAALHGSGQEQFADNYRSSEQSLRDFHDSEFALDISDLQLDATKYKDTTVFAIEEDLEEDEESSRGAADKSKLAALPPALSASELEPFGDDGRASEQSLRDFHDSEFELDLSDLNFDSTRSVDPTVFAIDEDEEDDEDSARGVPDKSKVVGLPSTQHTHGAEEGEEELDDSRMSSQSFRDFHDSEFELDLSDLNFDSTRSVDPTVFAIDEDLDEDEDSVPSANKFMGYGGSHSNKDEDEDDDGGYEFHDSEVGIDFTFEEIEEFNDAKYEAMEEIQEITTTSAAMVQRNRLLDELRSTRLRDYAIMDSAREASFDLIAAQAAQFMSCSLASVSFVDDRREFVKAVSGSLMIPSRSGGMTHEVHKQHSVAAHIVQRCASEELNVVLVLDALHDEALSANLFVYDAPFLRFIVGIPIKTRDGVVLGALVVADDRPRGEMTPTERKVLLDFGEQLNELMEERWQMEMYKRRGAAAPEQTYNTLQSLLSQSYHTGQQLRQQQQQSEQHNFNKSMPIPSQRPQHQPRYQQPPPPSQAQYQHHQHQSPFPQHHYDRRHQQQPRESVHGRMTMDGIEL